MLSARESSATVIDATFLVNENPLIPVQIEVADVRYSVVSVVDNEISRKRLRTLHLPERITTIGSGAFVETL